MREKPAILNTATLARTRIFHIEQVELRFANGVETRYERLVGSPAGAVMVVPLLDDETVLLIREYAVGVERYELGLPKGRIEPGESPLDAANREMQEEIGYAARELHPLTSLSLAPGYIGHTTHVVLARELFPRHAEGDEPESIEVVPWRLDRMDSLLERDDFTEARSIAALFMVRDLLRNAGR